MLIAVVNVSYPWIESVMVSILRGVGIPKAPAEPEKYGKLPLDERVIFTAGNTCPCSSLTSPRK